MEGILEKIIEEHAEHLLRLAYFYVRNRYEEMKIAEIALVLGIPENTVKTRLKRVQEALKPFLKQEEWEVLGHE